MPLADILMEEARKKANFCLRVGIAPSEYDNLTQYEITAFYDEHEEIIKEQERSPKKK